METVLLGQAGGTVESNLVHRLLRSLWRWRCGRHGRWRDRMWPTWRKPESIHLMRIVRAVVDTGLAWDARRRVRDLHW